MNILQSTVIVFSIIPMIPFIMAYGIGCWHLKDKKRALMMAMDITTLFLIFSVSALYNVTFGSHFGFYGIVLIVLITVGLIGGVQNRLKGEVNKKKLGKIVWRITFLAMSLSYMLLTATGLIKYIFTEM